MGEFSKTVLGDTQQREYALQSNLTTDTIITSMINVKKGEGYFSMVIYIYIYISV